MQNPFLAHRPYKNRWPWFADPCNMPQRKSEILQGVEGLAFYQIDKKLLLRKHTVKRDCFEHKCAGINSGR